MSVITADQVEPDLFIGLERAAPDASTQRKMTLATPDASVAVTVAVDDPLPWQASGTRVGGLKDGAPTSGGVLSGGGVGGWVGGGVGGRGVTRGVARGVPRGVAAGGGVGAAVGAGVGAAVGGAVWTAVGSKLPSSVIDSAGDGAKAAIAACVQVVTGTVSSEPSRLYALAGIQPSVTPADP